MKYAILFDLSDTLAKMRPPKLLVNRWKLSPLAKAGLIVAVVTGSRKTETLNVIQKLKIGKYFDFILTKEDLFYSKRDKRSAQKVKQIVNVNRFVFVGDSKSDYIFAKNMNCDFIYIGKSRKGMFQTTNINRAIDFVITNLIGKI